MLRSLWTHLRVCWDVRQTKTLFYLTQAIGWGLPGLFLALTIPITGVSYRVGPACVPNQKNAFLTWFGWLISFACLAALLQFVTTFFCLWLYLKDVFWGTSLTGTRMSEMETTTSTKAPTTVTSSDRKLAWKRVRKVLSLQWRSIVLTTLVIVEVVFFSVVFIHETSTALRLSSHQTDEIVTWAVCLITHLGRKEECLSITKILGLSEARIIASFMLAAVSRPSFPKNPPSHSMPHTDECVRSIQLIGYLTFALMLRRSMLRGWLDLLLHPRRRRRTSIGEEAFIIVSPKRKSFGRQLESEKPQPLTTTTNVDRDGPLLSPVSPMSPIAPSAVLPEVLNTLRGEPHRNLSIPRPGDVDRRHGTTNWFDEEEQGGDEGHRRVSRVSRLDDIP